MPHPRWLVLALLSVAQFMLILDVTVVNVALPDIGSDLHLTRATLTWVVTAYTLAFGGLMLLGGRLADLLGARRTLFAGLALFTTASLVTGLAPNASVLLAGRAAQGVGAALLSPAALSLVTTAFHGPDRNRALGIWAALGGSGSAAGVLLGGALTAGPGWPWVFFINVPVGIAVLLALPAPLRRLAPAHSTAGRRRVDVAGALAVTAATASLIYGLIRAGDTGWTSPGALVPIAAALALYGGFALVERVVPDPLMRIGTLGQRTVAAGTALMLVASGLLIAAFFLGSFALQHRYGYSPLATGVAFLPVAIGTVAGAQAASHLIGHAGARPLAVAGLAVAAAGTALPMNWSGATALIAGLAVAATGLGTTLVAATTTALSHVDPHRAGLTSGIVNTSHELGGALGVAVMSSLAVQLVGTATSERSTAAPSLAGGVAAAGATGFTRAFTATTIAALAAAAGAAVLAPRVKPPAGVSAHVH